MTIHKEKKRKTESHKHHLRALYVTVTYSLFH